MTVVETDHEFTDRAQALAAGVLDLVAGAATLPAALPALNAALGPTLGVAVSAVVISDRAWRAATGASEPDEIATAAIAAWRREEADERQPVPWEDTVLVPVQAGRRVVGLARVTGNVTLDSPAVRIVAAACGAIARSIYLTYELAQARIAVQDAAERAGAAAALHEAVDRLLDDIEARLGAVAYGVPEREWRWRFDDLAGVVLRGRREISRAAQLPDLLDARRKPGLAGALRELARRFERVSGTPVHAEVRGTPIALSGARERALFRVACEGLVAMDTEARASVVLLTLTFETDAIVLSMRDDGTGLVHRDPFAHPAGVHGLALLRQLAEPAGGTVEIKNLRPHGVAVECRMPATRRTGDR